MQSIIVLAYCICCLPIALLAQDQPAPQNPVAEFATYLDDLTDAAFAEKMQPRIAASQFIMLGETHGIVEVGQIARLLYEMGQPHGYRTLCIETDPLAAETIEGFYDAGQGVGAAERLLKQYPFSFPFYDNAADYLLFDHVVESNGRIWGIDQSLMAQYRMNFAHLLNTSTNEDLKALIAPELDRAVAAYDKAVTTRDFMAAYMFQYDESLHNRLMAVAKSDAEIAILEDLWTTKEIYGYQFSGQYYRNNETRGQLMKANFMDYYNTARQNEDLPKVVFKLGYNHAGRGLTFTRIYDIGNLASELANTNGMRSLHVLAAGVSGYQNRANPIEPEKSRQAISRSKYLPADFLDLAEATDQKYTVIDTEPMRPVAQKFSEEVQDFIFKFDTIILINDAVPNTSFK